MSDSIVIDSSKVSFHHSTALFNFLAIAQIVASSQKRTKLFISMYSEYPFASNSSITPITLFISSFAESAWYHFSAIADASAYFFTGASILLSAQANVD